MPETHCCVRGLHGEVASCYLHDPTTEEPYIGLLVVGQETGLHLAIPLGAEAARTLGETLIAASRPLTEAERDWKAMQEAADRG